MGSLWYSVLTIGHTGVLIVSGKYMNAKKCKKLRREARNETVAMLGTAYVQSMKRVRTRVITLIPNCTKAVYHRKKRAAETTVHNVNTSNMEGK